MTILDPVTNTSCAERPKVSCRQMLWPGKNAWRERISSARISPWWIRIQSLRFLFLQRRKLDRPRRQGCHVLHIVTLYFIKGCAFEGIPVLWKQLQIFARVERNVSLRRAKSLTFHHIPRSCNARSLCRGSLCKTGVFPTPGTITEITVTHHPECNLALCAYLKCSGLRYWIRWPKV